MTVNHVDSTINIVLVLVDCRRPLRNCEMSHDSIVAYRVGQKSKPTLSTHNFVKYWPIFKILSLSHSPRNLQ